MGKTTLFVMVMLILCLSAAAQNQLTMSTEFPEYAYQPTGEYTIGFRVNPHIGMVYPDGHATPFFVSVDQKCVVGAFWPANFQDADFMVQVRDLTGPHYGEVDLRFYIKGEYKSELGGSVSGFGIVVVQGNGGNPPDDPLPTIDDPPLEDVIPQDDPVMPPECDVPPPPSDEILPDLPPPTEDGGDVILPPDTPLPPDDPAPPALNDPPPPEDGGEAPPPNDDPTPPPE